MLREIKTDSFLIGLNINYKLQIAAALLIDLIENQCNGCFEFGQPLLLKTSTGNE